MTIDLTFWKDKKVFLTGHTGFKGGWLSVMLNALGAEVMGFSLPPHEQSFFNKADVISFINHKEGDIRDYESLLNAEREFNSDILIHMAAQPLVIRSYEDPVETFSTNIMGTVNVLELIRFSSSIKCGVIITTDKCYENRNLKRGYKESDPMGGYDPYSSSKGGAELVINSYQRSFFSKENYQINPKAIGSVRAGNVIGGGDYAENRLIPDFIRANQNDTKVRIRNPEATRPWQHVLEPLYGYLVVAQKLYKEGPSESDAWNFGPHEKDIRSVSEVADMFCSSWGGDIEWIKDLSSIYHETQNLSLDITKAKQTLGWTPKWDLEKTIDKVVEWYKYDFSGGNCLEISRSQILEYIDLRS